jgi:hypothetical protein
VLKFEKNGTRYDKKYKREFVWSAQTDLDKVFDSMLGNIEIAEACVGPLVHRCRRVDKEDNEYLFSITADKRQMVIFHISLALSIMTNNS